MSLTSQLFEALKEYPGILGWVLCIGALLYFNYPKMTQSKQHKPAQKPVMSNSSDKQSDTVPK